MGKKIVLFAFFFTLFFQFLYAQSLVKSVGKPEKISNKDHFFMRPSWSPTGDKIAFTGPKQKGLWIFDVRSNEIEQINNVEGAGYRFSWSPDGVYIAYRARYVENYRAKMAIEIVHVGSKKVTLQTLKQKQVGLPQWGQDITTVLSGLT